MQLRVVGSVLGALVLGGCYAAPPPPPVVEREVVDQNGNVIERDRYYYGDTAPAPRVEVVGVAPYPTAVWIRGYWVRGGRHRWIWVPGHWR